MYVEAINNQLIDQGSNLELMGSCLILKNGDSLDKIADLSGTVIGDYEANDLYVCSAVLKPNEPVEIKNSLALFSEDKFGVMVDSITISDSVDYAPSWGSQHGEEDNTWQDTDVLEWSSLTNDRYEMSDDGTIDHPLLDISIDGNYIIPTDFGNGWYDIDVYISHCGVIINPSLSQTVLNNSLNTVIVKIIKISK